jgi:hypothetical protein
MRQELDEALVAKYPQIFKDRNGNPRDTLMCFGFEHGDGWYHIIDTLCGLLTSEYRQCKNSYEFAKECFDNGGKTPWNKEVTAEEVATKKLAMEEAEKKIPVAVQIKEKFGGLRFYVNGAIEKHWNYITFAESMSYSTCEVCGSPGKRYTDGWHQTLCETHAKEQNRQELNDDEDMDS